MGYTNTRAERPNSPANGHPNSLHILPGTLPLPLEASFSMALKPYAHCDRTAPFHVLILVLKGSMEIIEDGVVWRLAPRSCFFLKSGVHHWGVTPFPAGTAWYYAHFQLPQAEAAASGAAAPEASIPKEPAALPPGTECLPKYLELPDNSPVPKAFEAMVEGMDTDRRYQTLHNALALGNLLLAILEEAERIRDAHAPRGDKALVRRIHEYVREHAIEGFTKGDLEAACGRSYKYAGAVFTTAKGMSLRRWQTELRIQYASRLLCESDRSVAAIAEDCGFNDPFTFSRAFRRITGYAPSEYRNLAEPRI